MGKIKQKPRNQKRKERRKLLLIAVEGKNKTEKNYFKALGDCQEEYCIQYVKGNETDPEGIVRNAVVAYNKEELEESDLCFCVFDTDFNKEDQIRKAQKMAARHPIRILLSNPCFEIWFILHFAYTTKSFTSNDEVIEELKKYYPAYQKNCSSFEWLSSWTDKAIQNAARLKQHHQDVNNTNNVLLCNPGTEVDHLVEYLFKK